MTNVFKTNVLGTCPGGFCDYIQAYSEILVVILCLDGFIFFVTLLPPLFSWSNKKPDGRKRIFFAALACFTFYFWLAFLAVNSLYCFGFLAHEGPCKKAVNGSGSAAVVTFSTKTKSTLPTTIPTSIATFPTLPESSLERPAATKSSMTASTSSPEFQDIQSTLLPEVTSLVSYLITSVVDPAASAEPIENITLEENPSIGVPMPLISWTSDKANSSCVQLANEHETQLKNLTLVNILILVVLFIVFIANAREAMTAKALYHKETLCKREEVQRFLSSLVLKPPEVGHLINCFHVAKTNSDTRNKKANVAATAANLKKKDACKDGGPPRKVITFSAIENFAYQTWRDFSDLRLIEPSPTYPIIEIEIVLNFFPGDHFTAEKYKAFVNQMTKTHSGKDQRITIDDYFHVEDHREWTFFVGNEGYITPWWDKDAAKIPLSCFFLLGWPFRMAYGGRIAKHQVEIKKAVFVENNSADEGVSLSATPASEDVEATASNGVVVENHKQPAEKTSIDGDEIDEANDDDDMEAETKVMLEASKGPAVTSTASSSNHEQFTEYRVNAVVSQPPKEALVHQQQQQQQQNFSDPLQSHHHFFQQMQMGPSIPTTYNSRPHPAFGHPLAQVLPPHPTPITQQHPLLPLRSAAHQQPLRPLREKDLVTAVTHQDVNGVNTVALKDIDVQMTAVSGYETYV